MTRFWKDVSCLSLSLDILMSPPPSLCPFEIIMNYLWSCLVVRRITIAFSNYFDIRHNDIYLLTSSVILRANYRYWKSFLHYRRIILYFCRRRCQLLLRSYFSLKGNLIFTLHTPIFESWISLLSEMIAYKLHRNDTSAAISSILCIYVSSSSHVKKK